MSCLPIWVQSKLKRSNSELNHIKIKFRNSRYEPTQSVLISPNENSIGLNLRGNPSISESNSSIVYKTINTSRTMSSEKNLLTKKKFDSSVMYKRSLTLIPKCRGNSSFNNDQILSESRRSLSLKTKNEYSGPSFIGLSKNYSNSYISLMTTTNFTKRMKVYSRTTIILLTISTAYLVL